MLPDNAVEHISIEEIELLAENVRIEGATPEVIAEQHLGYDLVITDDGIFKDQNILGGISFEEKTIFINASAEAHEGRYNFTVAHEIGHHVLHRDIYLKLFNNQNGIMCREQNQKPLVERQADRFAAAMLMPAREIQLVAESERWPTNLGMALNLAQLVQRKLSLSHVSTSALVNRLIDLQLVSSDIPYQTGISMRGRRYRAVKYPGWARFIYRAFKKIRT